MIRRRAREGERGQGLVEFSLLVPVFTLLLLAMLEFGFVFDHLLTIQYSTREGARVGAALASGGTSLDCNDVDQYVIAAVTRVLQSRGSRISIAEVPTIRIYKAGVNGTQDTSYPNAYNVWSYAPGAGPLVDGRRLDYRLTSTGWSACGRNNGANPDSIGVSLAYTYRLQTAIGSVLGFFGGSMSNITISDKTVMSLNPTD